VENSEESESSAWIECGGCRRRFQVLRNGKKIREKAGRVSVSWRPG